MPVKRIRTEKKKPVWVKQTVRDPQRCEVDEPDLRMAVTQPDAEQLPPLTWCASKANWEETWEGAGSLEGDGREIRTGRFSPGNSGHFQNDNDSKADVRSLLTANDHVYFHSDSNMIYKQQKKNPLLSKMHNNIFKPLAACV